MSRIIVKNIPKEVTEYDLQEHFSSKGDVTDVKIMKTTTGKPRLFAFIGFKEEDQGKSCIKYFNKTYIKTNKIVVEEAKVQGDKALNKPWSKHTKWSDNKKAIKEKVPTIKKEDTRDKIKKLKEIEKITSAKYKFDVMQGFETPKELNLNEQKENNQESAQEEENKNNKKSKKSKSSKNTEVEVDIKPEENETKKSTLNELDEYDSKRLYLRNLSFQVTEEDLEKSFSKFGKLTEASIPRDRNKKCFGYGFVSYETTESAILALEKMDKKIYQGRILHITPAKVKDSKPSLDVNDLTKTQMKNNKSSFKKEKLLKLKSEYDKEVSWNFLFLNQNAVIEAVSRQTGVEKQDLLSKDNAKLAVEVASMETIMINKTKEWLESQGIDLTPFSNKRLNCTRSKTILLIKNIDTSLQEDELKKVFSRFGELLQFMISPHNVMGIAEFIDAANAENCFKNLSFYEINGLPLYLEYAPVGLKLEKESAKNNDVKTEDDLVFDKGNVVFVNNLSFDTKETSLLKLFEKFNPSTVKIIKNKTKTNKDLSAGYGFVEFKSSEDANEALKKLQGAILDSHSIKLSIAKSKKNDAAKEKNEMELLAHKRKRDTELGDIDLEDFDTAKEDKLLVKNIAFEATKEELRDLFKQFGDVKNVRLPKKTTGEHRGYAFIEFLTYEEAKGAFTKLANTHFYGRKLVIEWAKKDKTVEEIRNDTQKKVQTFSEEVKPRKDKRTVVFN